ncbi:MAG: hypothetical protein ACPG61_17440 [Paracoccaceae bacterium]
MAELSQVNFDRSECIADAMHSIHGLELALIHELDPILAKAGPDKECTIMALINACAMHRQRATRIAREIAVSGKARV